jgi:hypothetical protein
MLNRQAVLVLGERLNEWRSTHARIHGTEYLQEPLSDAEINRLLDCLSSNSTLNKLGELSRDLQFAAIKRNYQQELLVAMREATEGRAFDAIIEDEYRGIPDELARRMYLVVCCFYQHGAYVRDSLLAELINLPLSELHGRTAVETEGVVIFDEIDPAYGRFAARARHRKIAAVVWERTAEAGEREEIVVSALAGMNLNYSADAKAFEDFVRSDRLVDSIRTLDSRIKFFEHACQKDPQSPYVRQHYARMLLRAKQLNLALAQIDSALAINQEIRVLHHTRGVVLSELALSTESTEIARRRLVQSEEEFRKCIHLHPKDDYAFQTLARLFVNWAWRMADSNEATEYLAKAEAVINEGLRVVKVRDGLWIVSSEIQDLVGKEPEYFKALERAVHGELQKFVAVRRF